MQNSSPSKLTLWMEYSFADLDKTSARASPLSERGRTMGLRAGGGSGTDQQQRRKGVETSGAVEEEIIRNAERKRKPIRRANFDGGDELATTGP